MIGEERLRAFRAWEVSWGSTLCEACRVRPAEVTFEAIPLCVEGGCVDALVDRAFAVDMQPSSVQDMPAVFEERVSPRRRRPRELDESRTPLDWLLEKGYPPEQVAELVDQDIPF